MGKLIEILAILIAIASFVWEIRNATKEQQIIIWVLLVTILIMLCIFIALNYLRDKVRQLDSNSIKIANMEQELNIRKNLEQLHYKIGNLEGELHGKIQK